MDPATAKKHSADAWAALQRGDAADALAVLRVLIDQDDPATPWMIVARAHSMAGNLAGEQDALHRQLRGTPNDLLALLRLGDLRRVVGDDRAATSFYQTAISAAAASQQPPPTAIQNLLEQAHHHVADAHKKFTGHLESAIASGTAAETGRVAAAVDLLLGRKQLYLQQPSSFYFPGLPQRQFYERGEFDWLPAVEAAVPDMQAELQAVLSETADFDPYIVAGKNRPRPQNPLFEDARWGARYFWQNGEAVSSQAERCPATMAALALAPMPFISERSPMALWSMLKPGTHIQPHHGLLNTRLICHIPLIVPGNCALRVGNETRAWQAGKALIFDDSIEHEAWNRSDAIRVMLLFEIWRPELSQAERDGLTRIFEAINSFQGAPIEVD